MLKKLRKSSSQVTLVLIGLAGLGALSGCSQEETRRDVYATKEDCLKDWGNNPADCEPANDRPRTTSGGYHYYGRPYTYFGNSSSTATTASGARSSRAVSSSTVSRGGFGSSGHSSSS